MNANARYFEMFYCRPDRRRDRASWYARRKCALLLAALHRKHYRRALELGCARGEITSALAPRCAELVATDADDAAVACAQQRVEAMAGVQVLQMRHPAEWPLREFDLVVCCGLGCCLDDAELATTCRLIADSLARDALVIACHRRAAVHGHPWTGDEVHARMARELPLTSFCHHEESDLLLDGWTRDGRPVAASAHAHG